MPSSLILTHIYIHTCIHISQYTYTYIRFNSIDFISPWPRLFLLYIHIYTYIHVYKYICPNKYIHISDSAQMGSFPPWQRLLLSYTEIYWSLMYTPIYRYRRICSTHMYIHYIHININVYSYTSDSIRMGSHPLQLHSLLMHTLIYSFPVYIHIYIHTYVNTYTDVRFNSNAFTSPLTVPFSRVHS